MDDSSKQLFKVIAHSDGTFTLDLRRCRTILITQDILFVPESDLESKDYESYPYRDEFLDQVKAEKDLHHD